MRHLPIVAAAAIAGALPSARAPAQEADAGAALYASHCAACHGEGGLGDGDLAGLLSVAPPDLTQLAAMNEGRFPMGRVIQVIDGRGGVRAHGAPMPVFGAVFRPGGAGPGLEYGSEIEARGRTLALALYIESIQAY